ncbi:MAG TPA: hypothetical protein VFO31_00070 [Vicinamibacterales bacterium]|nr:hypothetical protein [Vicinamibacterales bacterium]
MRKLVACAAILTATSVLAQTPSKLDVEGRQGGYNWVVETAADGSRRGGWVPISIPLEQVDRGALKPLPPIDDATRAGQTSPLGQASSGVTTAGAAPREDLKPSESRRRGGSQALEVQIVDRHTSETNYSYVVPGHITSQSHSTANCFGLGGSVNCSGSSTTHATATSPRPTSYDVRGATFSLRLPDGRIAIVNCHSKYALRGDHINRRSCRMPWVNRIQVEFDGDDAKLIWPVSLDGSKTASETYKIVAILDGQ